MDAFSPTPPDWTQSATHGFDLLCPRCGAGSREATCVWLNRRSPVYGSDHQRKWQEFYQCSCHHVWWAWNTDRPRPARSAESETHPDPTESD